MGTKVKPNYPKNKIKVMIDKKKDIEYIWSKCKQNKWERNNKNKLHRTGRDTKEIEAKVKCKRQKEKTDKNKKNK